MPETVTENRERRTTNAVFLFGEDAPELRLQADDVEEVRRDDGAGDLLRFAPGQAAQVVGIAARDREMLESGIVAPEVEVVRKCDRDGALLRTNVLVEDDEPLGVRIRQRPKEDGVNDAEDRGVRADAERQREDGNKGEAWCFPKLTNGVAKFVHVTRSEVR